MFTVQDVFDGVKLNSCHPCFLCHGVSSELDRIIFNGHGVNLDRDHDTALLLSTLHARASGASHLRKFGNLSIR